MLITDLGEINEESAQDALILDEINEYFNSLIQLDSALTLVGSAEELALILPVIDPADHLGERGITSDMGGLEAIELKVSLELKDLRILWKMMRPIFNSMANRYDQKTSTYGSAFSSSYKGFSKDTRAEKYGNKPLPKALTMVQHVDMIKTFTRGIKANVPKTLPVIANPGDYNRLVKKFNFDKDMLKLGLRIGKFVNIGRAKQTNKQFYRKTTFEYPYAKGRTAHQLGYPDTSKLALKQYKSDVDSFLSTIKYVRTCLKSYPGDLKKIGVKLSGMTDTKASTLAALQIKILNDYLRMFGTLLHMLDSVFARLALFGSNIKSIT